MSRVLWFVLILVLAVAGCKASELGPSPLESPLLAAADSPLPTPVAVETATPIPTPRDGLATVTGTLVQTQGGLPSGPMANALLFLAPLIYSTDGTSTMARLNKGTDPSAVTDATGRFTFLNVEPNTYALVYSSGTLEFLLKDPDSNEDLLITVVAGQMTDLGEVYIETPGR